MNKEDLIRLAVVLHVLQENIIMGIEDGGFKRELRRCYNVLRSQFKKLTGLIFKDSSKDQIDNYDEWANQILDLIEKSQDIGIERSNAILKAYINGDIREE